MPVSAKEQRVIDFLKENKVPERFTTAELSKIIGVEIAPTTMTRLTIFAIFRVYETKPRTYSVLSEKDGGSLFKI